jgi:plasmid replication initiation protein
MKHKELTVYKANEVIEAGYRLSLNEQRVILACIGQVDSAKELLETDEFELSAKDFARWFSVSDDRAYHALIDVTDTLFNRQVTIDQPYPDRKRVKKIKMRWISSIKYLDDDGKLVLRFAQDMLPYLGQLKKEFTKYKLEHIGKMTSVYAIRLYELLMQWHSTGKREVAIDWLKRQFEIEDDYERMFDFKARVLDPAVADINTHSNLQVSWAQRKTGRRVTHLIFTFGEKSGSPTAAKEARSATEPRIDGVAKSEVERLARPGESYAGAAERIARARKKPRPASTAVSAD